MTSTYIVTEGQTDRDILTLLLPDELTQDVHFMVSGGSNSAPSLATTLLIAKGLPVALVIDADETDTSQVRQYRADVEALLNRALHEIPRIVLLAVPEIESIFLHDKAELERLAGQKFTDAEWESALQSPKRWLRERLNLTAQDMLRLADAPALATWRTHPLIVDLSVFLQRQATFQPQ
jgi:hypothetical protein